MPPEKRYKRKYGVANALSLRDKVVNELLKNKDKYFGFLGREDR
jgi:hypothetical protein